MHYYQPLWTLVGAGVKRTAETVRNTKEVLPNGVQWVPDHAASINPDTQVVTTRNGDTITYEFCIIAVGVKNDYDKV